MAESMDRPREQVKREFQEDLQMLKAFSHAPAAHESLSGSELNLNAIPDLGSEFGFGAPVAYGTYSHTHTPEATEREEGDRRLGAWTSHEHPMEHR